MTDTQHELAPIGERSPELILELLGRRFRPDAIKQRKVGGGRQVAYIPVEAVIERLNKACNTWHFRIVSRERETMILNRWNDATRKSEPKEVSVSVTTGELEIPELGIRQAIGVQALDDGSGEDLLKGAGSDALKKCASLFGVRVEGSDYGFTSTQEQAGETTQQAPPAAAPRPEPDQEPARVAQSQPAPEPVQRGGIRDYSEEGEWIYWNRKLHGAAAKVGFANDPHDVVHTWAHDKGYPSVKNAPPDEMKALHDRFVNEPKVALVWERGLKIVKPEQASIEDAIESALTNATPGTEAYA